MKTLKEYIVESQQWMQSPAEGDDFAIELPDETICETYIIEVADDCILLDSTPEINAALAEHAKLEDTDEGESGIVLEGMFSPLNDDEVQEDQDAAVVAGKEAAIDATRNFTDEAKYQGREVALGKPMQGDVKKFKVYVRDPKTGNVKKVNFGDKTMRIKKSNPARRKSFRARHNCANPGPRTKARYWSCRKW